jgi:hypothetical protein
MAATTPNASAEPMSMFHQSEEMPWAAPLLGSRASCFEPQPATRNATGASVRNRARDRAPNTLSPGRDTLSVELPG